jgi:diguanylate cyclase (GGDEF)-like protein
VVSRYGGDEFVILIENVDETAARAALDRVRQIVAEPIALSSGDVVNVRASAGLAIDDGDADIDELLSHADAAMYRAKITPR